PVAGDLGRNQGLHFLPAGDALAAELKLGIRRLVRAHRLGLGGPPKDLLVEGDRLVDAARVELRPSEGVRFADRHGGSHGPRLPGRNDRAARILEGRHAALITDVEGRRAAAASVVERSTHIGLFATAVLASAIACLLMPW